MEHRESDFPGTENCPLISLFELHPIANGKQASVQTIERRFVKTNFSAVFSRNAPTEASLVELGHRSAHLCSLFVTSSGAHVFPASFFAFRVSFSFLCVSFSFCRVSRELIIWPGGIESLVPPLRAGYLYLEGSISGRYFISWHATAAAKLAKDCQCFPESRLSRKSSRSVKQLATLRAFREPARTSPRIPQKHPSLQSY